jgi:DNA-binding MarR family transcriptional regulator
MCVGSDHCYRSQHFLTSQRKLGGRFTGDPVEKSCRKNIAHRKYVYIHLFDMNPSLTPELPCMCGSLRRTSRALTQSYEKALRPLGLRATQLTILQVLSGAGEVSQGQLGKMLAMDSTTLTRTLEIMFRKGWIAERRGQDRRERWLCLAKGGETKLKRVLPVWENVQSLLRRQLGDQAWKDLLQLTYQATDIATTLGDSL